MSVKYILSQVGAKIGLNPNASASRTVLLRFLNEAADELWSECDITGSLMECTFKVNGDQTISMPMDVGAVRAVRDANNRIAWHISQMRPRYNELNWLDGWYNYRLKNTQALMMDIVNSAPVTVSVSELNDTPFTVSITGSTETAESITEDFVMSSLSVTGIFNFITITAVTKTVKTKSNVTVTDCEGNILTVLPNNKTEARYQILDISSAPWLPKTNSPTDNYVEILYKKSLPYLSEDGDEFPAQGYDNQLVNKCLQLYYEEQGKGDLAVAYDAKATRGLARKKQEQNLATEDVVSFVSNMHDSLQPRIRGRRFTLWSGRRRG